MKRSDALQVLAMHADAITAMGATSLYLFGSTARDEATAESDLDLFFDYDRSSKFSLLDLAGIKLFLEERLQAPVDVVDRTSLHPKLRPDIERSAIRVY